MNGGKIMCQYYDLCCRHRGEVVTIFETCGKRHVGRIVQIDRRNVYIEPISRGRVAGYSWGYYPGWGYPGYGYYYRPWVPVALAAIGGFIVGAALFW